LQLNNKKRRAGQVRESIASLSAALLAATITPLASSAAAQDYSNSDNYNRDTFGPGIAYSELDSALLVYKEGDGRVKAIEPSTDLSVHGPAGQEISLGLVFDSVSGATPNGAVPSDLPQTFVTPIKAQGSTATVTSASGGSTIIHLPPSPGDLAAAALGRQYIVPANALPMDRGFHDHRWAINFGWSQPMGGIYDVGLGGGYSIEQDYRAISVNTRLAQNFNSSNTTLSLALNAELDSSFPYGGVPAPLTEMNPQWKSPTSRGKTQMGFVLGLTEVVARHWLMQLNYSFDWQSGYQNDPYRILSVVDPASGEPLSYLYENRPRERKTQSVFWENKFDFGPTVTDLSLRYFRDDWGITSKTAEIAERINLSHSIYVEPSARWYQQSAANFFDYYLVQGQPLPTYATSDTRLGKFTSLTYGVKVGFKPTGRTEFYIRGNYYRQTGDGHPSNAIGQLQQQNLFAGSKAAYVLIGYTWDFH